ncbi:Holliday junction resolvase RuvX [Gammaproteobacteria bacterium]|nr:Holliday junction resolvase RuvX [Gammaproteobacteria bacterium]
MIVIGVDFGLRYWGCALGFTMTTHTEPLGSLSANDGQIDLTQLDQWVKSYQVNTIIIGLPKKQDGSDFEVTKHAQQAFLDLQAYYNLPVHQVDEHMTSVEARDELYKVYGMKGLSKENIDIRSAQLILERWFALSGYL